MPTTIGPGNMTLGPQTNHLLIIILCITIFNRCRGYRYDVYHFIAFANKTSRITHGRVESQGRTASVAAASASAAAVAAAAVVDVAAAAAAAAAVAAAASFDAACLPHLAAAFSATAASFSGLSASVATAAVLVPVVAAASSSSTAGGAGCLDLAAAIAPEYASTTRLGVFTILIVYRYLTSGGVRPEGDP